MHHRWQGRRLRRTGVTVPASRRSSFRTLRAPRRSAGPRLVAKVSAAWSTLVWKLSIRSRHDRLTGVDRRIVGMHAREYRRRSTKSLADVLASSVGADPMRDWDRGRVHHL